LASNSFNPPLEKEAEDVKAALFKRLYGVKPAAFEKMLSILQKEYNALHQKGGKPLEKASAIRFRLTLTVDTRG
jgi:hypothetical protein